MFTANSMNCLTEASGLSLPGNGSLLATHAARKDLFLEAGRLIVSLARRWYEQDDASVLPRSIASFEAFENAMSLDIAMGGSTNTVLHLLAAAYEGGVSFSMADIDRLSRRVPNLCKVAPSTQKYHMEDVHRAGGVIGILAELDRAGLIHRELPTVHSATLGEALERWDVRCTKDEEARLRYLAAPGGIPTQVAFSQVEPLAGSGPGSRRGLYPRSRACLQPRRRTGGAVRQPGRGRLHREDRRGRREHVRGRRAALHHQRPDLGDPRLRRPGACLREPGRRRHRHPHRSGQGRRRGRDPLRRTQRRTGHAGNALPDQLSQIEGTREILCLITDGRFSGGTSGLSIGHISPEAAEGGLIALVEDGDPIEIHIASRRIHLAVDDQVLAARRAAMQARGAAAWKPLDRRRQVSTALKAYALLTTSAARGAVRDLSRIERDQG
jgi:dihydroxy-acid dehydratase